MSFKKRNGSSGGSLIWHWDEIIRQDEKAECYKYLEIIRVSFIKCFWYFKDQQQML